jgi:hypothetical protein
MHEKTRGKLDAKKWTLVLLSHAFYHFLTSHIQPQGVPSSMVGDTTAAVYP